MTDNTMVKRKEQNEKQWSSKYYTENKNWATRTNEINGNKLGAPEWKAFPVH